MNLRQKIKLFSLMGWSSFIVAIFGVGYSFENQAIGFSIFGIFMLIAFPSTFYERRLKNSV